ncbi:hypothetical protein TTY48_04470 [Tsukamurella sp. TY48]|nr:SIMPL domain-containing protein [Tsukamurella sp. TY48]GIZ95835.1 hypothetical protein TTY48_04470 [Tsukamurella sp. TY48]
MTSTIRQTGTGSAPAVPDVVIARIGVQTRASDVAAAFTGASAAAHAVVAAVRAAGVADGDIATTDVGLQAVETGPWEDRRLEGYAASESLTVTVRDTGRAAAVLQAAAAAAGDAARIESVTFAVSDGDGPLERAREAAFADARRRAEQYARLAGAALGPVRSIADEPAGPGPMPGVMFASKQSDSGPAMAVGERSVSAQVTVEWELSH